MIYTVARFCFKNLVIYILNHYILYRAIGIPGSSSNVATMRYLLGAIEIIKAQN